MHRLLREAYNSFRGNIAPVSGLGGSPRRVFLFLFLFLFYPLFHLRLPLLFLTFGPVPFLRLSVADSLPAINPSATIRGSNCIINCVCPCVSCGPQRAEQPRAPASNRRFQDPNRMDLSEISTDIKRGNRSREFLDRKILLSERNESHDC